MLVFWSRQVTCCVTVEEEVASVYTRIILKEFLLQPVSSAGPFKPSLPPPKSVPTLLMFTARNLHILETRQKKSKNNIMYSETQIQMVDLCLKRKLSWYIWFGLFAGGFVLYKYLFKYILKWTFGLISYNKVTLVFKNHMHVLYIRSPLVLSFLLFGQRVFSTEDCFVSVCFDYTLICWPALRLDKVF